MLRQRFKALLHLSLRGDDKLVWKLSQMGNFEMRSAYLLATNSMEDLPFFGSWIWKAQTLPKIPVFVWKSMQESIGVKSCLARRGMLVDTSCPLCQIEVETITHALRDCNMARAIWYQLGICVSNTRCFTQNLKDWLTANGKSVQKHSLTSPPWNVLFFFAVWEIWRQRNIFVFKHRSSNPSLAKGIVAQATEFSLCADRARSISSKRVWKIRWDKPELGWMKLNTDGASNALLGLAGGGGLIRDEAGVWVASFTRKPGKVNSFCAELWALRDGLLLCQ